MVRRSSFTDMDMLQLDHLAMIKRRNVLEIMSGDPANCLARSRLGSISSSRCQTIPHAASRQDSEHAKLMFRGRALNEATSSIVRQPSGGARRDRTDDLMLAKHALSQLSYGPVPEDECSTCRLRRTTLRCEVVGLGRLELPTSRLSSARSNQLSYKPVTRGSMLARTGSHRMHRTSASTLARARPRRKRNEDGGVPPMELNDPEMLALMCSKRSDRDAEASLKDHP